MYPSLRVAEKGTRMAELILETSIYMAAAQQAHDAQNTRGLRQLASEALGPPSIRLIPTNRA